MTHSVASNMNRADLHTNCVSHEVSFALPLALGSAVPKHDFDGAGLDVRFVQQKVGPGVLDLVQVLKIEYNPAYPAHLPWKVTDAALQTTIYTWNARGQIVTVTNARNETTTFTYESSLAANGYGRVVSITGALSGATRT